MKPELRIYRDTKLDIKATYLPVVKKKLLDIAWDFNNLFAR